MEEDQPATFDGRGDSRHAELCITTKTLVKWALKSVVFTLLKLPKIT
jgi:hypothetical protein